MRITFDHKTVVERLRSVLPAFRYLFASGCAARLVPSLNAFMATSTAVAGPSVADAARMIWSPPGVLSDLEMKRGFEQCKKGANALEDRVVGPLSLAAGDALACMGYAFLSMRTHKPEDAAWAGSRASDTFFSCITKYTLAPGKALIVLDRATLDGVFANPLCMEELHRQKRDLDLLQTIDSSNADAISRSVRSFNEKDGELILNVLQRMSSRTTSSR